MDQRTVFMAMLILLWNKSSLSSISCGRAEYRIEKECCPMCSPGMRVHKHCTEYKSTSCIPCTSGTYLDEPNGLTECFHCSICHSGSGLQVKRQCTTTDDTLCEPAVGYYCTESRKDSCIATWEHSICKPGQYISQKGTAKTDIVCDVCSGDTYSDGTFTSCKPHTICDPSLELQLQPGSHSNDTICGPLELSNHYIIIICTTIIILALIAVLIAALCKKRQCTGAQKAPSSYEEVHQDRQTLPHPVQISDQGEESTFGESKDIIQSPIRGRSPGTEMELNSVSLLIIPSS